MCLFANTYLQERDIQGNRGKWLFLAFIISASSKGLRKFVFTHKLR